MAKYKSAAEPVFNSLMSAIAAREYAPGDRLPSEKDLEERYGVSRVTIRTALNMLSTLGVIETKTGGGSYVKKFDFSFITGVASKLILAQVPGEDIVQYRSVIETAAVRDLEGKKVLSSDIAYLENCCRRMRDGATQKKRIEADFDFHRHICKMSGNKLFLYSYDMMRSLMIESFRQRLLVSNDGYSKANAEKGIQAHLDLVKKIQDGDIEGALKIAEALVRPSIPEFVVAAQNYSDPHTEGDE